MKSLVEVIEGFGKVVAVILVQPEEGRKHTKRSPTPKAMGVEPVRKRRRRRTKAEMLQQAG